MVVTACNISAGKSPPPSPGRPARPLLLRPLGVLKNKRTYEGGWTSICSTRSTTSPSEGKMEKYLLKPLGLRPKIEMGSFPYSGPPTDIAETVSLPRRQRVHEYPRAWHADLPTTSRAPDKGPNPLHPEPTHGALDRTAELLAKLLSGSEDPDVTALSEAVKAKLGITEPLPRLHSGGSFL